MLNMLHQQSCHIKKTFLAIGQNATCGNYRLMNKWTRFDKYATPLKEIFDALGGPRF